jgi:FdrA protein
VRLRVERNRYHDSVSLMAATEGVRALEGVTEAVLVMGTPMNQALLERVGMDLPEAQAAGPVDLIIAVRATDEAAAAAGLAEAERLLAGGAPTGASMVAAPMDPRTIREALRVEPDLNLAFISVPGAYAAYEARQALRAGLDVMLYSDNVPLAVEVELKRFAAQQGRLCMGPDCGTAILGGVGLGFANAVRRGSIGIVAASGTGAQELSVLIDRMGGGISELIGVGGRDLSAEVGGLMSLAALERLQADPGTGVIVLIAKPPAPEVRGLVEARAAAGPKPVVLCFLDGSRSIDEAAAQAVHLGSGRTMAELAAAVGGDLLTTDSQLWPTIGPERSEVIGLFSGGSLCDQALAILEESLGPIHCNIHANPQMREGCGKQEAVGHLLLDLGDDQFTLGRPHPMIDFGLRRELCRWAVERRTTAVILLDVVLGWGVHPDPAGALMESIEYAHWNRVPVILSVTGTEGDPQGYSQQVARLKQAGALVMPTARQAALVAALAVTEGREGA